MSSEGGAPGALIVVSGPSGVGKTTLCRAAMAAFPTLRFSVSCTTRAPRSGEREGADYHFVTEEEFGARVIRGEFLENARVYGHRYGTLRAEVEGRLARGESVLLDIDTQGAAQVRESGIDATFAFVLPPSVEALEERLRQRATDAAGVIGERVRKARAEMEQAWRADYLVVNDDLARAESEFVALVRAELLRRARRVILARLGLPSGPG